jgi:hypothetical protein
MGAIRLAGENECPEGTPIGSQYDSNGHLQAHLRREVEDFEIVDKECVKPSFSDTLLIRAAMRLSRCAGWLGLGLLCCAEYLLAFSMSEGQASRARAAGLWRTWAIRSSRF